MRKINTSGIISTIAGIGTNGYSGDGGLATLAQMEMPTGIAIDASGNIYFADIFNNRIRVICPSNCFTGTNDISEKNISLTLYPNPNNGKFTIQLNQAISHGKLILINSLGQKVCEQIIFQGTNNINVDKFSKGLYHFVLLQNNITLQSGNVTLE